MIKNIKRAGIIFLAVAIICLMAIGCLSVNSVASIGTNSMLNNAKSNTADLNSGINNASEIDESDVVEEVLLDGVTCSEQAYKWADAIKKSKADGGKKHIKVKLMTDWVAQEDINWSTEYRTTFAMLDITESEKLSAIGFNAGRISVPMDCKITIDLNGHKLNRNMPIGSRVTSGCVICSFGILNIYDSKFDYDKVLEMYEMSPEKMLYMNSGGLTGAGDSNSAGGVCADGEFASVIVNNCMIYNNRTSNTGSGAYSLRKAYMELNNVVFFDNGPVAGYNNDNDSSVISEVQEGVIKFNSGILYNNFANKQLITIADNISYNDIIIANNTIKDGYVINLVGTTSNSTIEINNTIIENNILLGQKTQGVGGINVAGKTKLNIHNLTMKNNQFANNGNNYGGGIVISGGVNATVTLTGINDINGNIIGDVKSDFYLLKNGKIGLGANCEFIGEKIVINMADDYSDGTPLTNGYGLNYGDTNPNEYFCTEKVGNVMYLYDNEIYIGKTLTPDKYDFVYVENNIRKSYKESSLYHGVNDYDISKVLNGGSLVLGNILPSTSITEFITNTKIPANTIKLYDNRGNLVFDLGNASSNIDINNGDKYPIATGWEMKVCSQSTGAIIESIKLSVLGDLTGDGKINSADVTLLRRIINSSSEDMTFEEYVNRPELKMSMLIVNRGKVSNSDANILWNVVCGTDDISNFY